MRLRPALLLLCVGCASAKVERVLDDFHAAAAEADEERYFAHFAPEGVFLGTDADERWTVFEFRAYAHPLFAEGRGWTYRPRDRHVTVADDGNVAWFDEMLDHASYGELRGTGVLRKVGGEWKIAQYNLTFTIPNARLPDVVEGLRGGRATRPRAR
ncbi:MAG: nuclear transport factor 2 family protein [Planctomycetota bacterium]|jgi:ketosteroid isomerase-like protein